MAFLIDTSVLVNVERRGQSLDRVAGQEERAISAITASELLHGVHRAKDESTRARRRAFVEHVLGAIEPLPITLPIARAHTGIWAQLEQAGNPVGAHDLWIAATALTHGMTVATLNPGDFERVAGLDVTGL